MNAEAYITVRDLVDLLDANGFTPGPRRSGSRQFIHDASGAKVSLPVKDPGRRLAAHITSTRFFLDQFGLMDRGDFEEWMWRLAIARKDRATGNGARKNGAVRKASSAGPRVAKRPALRAVRSAQSVGRNNAAGR